ncbi:MAG: ureidoglycolate lyase [Halanaerobiales bacterium]
MIKELKVKPISRKNFADCGIFLNPEDHKPKLEEDIFVFWDNLGFMEKNHEYEVGFLQVNSRKEYFNTLERHLQTQELFYALNDAILLVSRPSGNKLPDPDRVKALKVKAGSGVIFKKGAWHWIPFPEKDGANFIVIFQKNTPEKDLEKIDLLEEKNIKFKLKR